MGVTEVIKSIVATVRERDVTFLAASIAYYAFVSVIPLLVLVLVIGSAVGGEAFADRLLAVMEGALSSSGREMVLSAVTSERGRSGASVVSLVTLTWSALKLFRGIDLAFDEVYGSATDSSLLQQIRDGLAVVAAIVLAAALMVAISAVVGFAGSFNVPFAGLLGRLVLLVGLAVVFLPVYYVMPPIPVTVREILPGAAFAAVGWTVLQVGFQIYAANAGAYQAYGVLGAVLLFVTWLYFGGVLLLVGAALNAVLSGRGEPA